MRRLLAGVALAALGSITTANASVVWTNWTSGVIDPVNGSASGTMGGIAVSYSGEMQCLNCNFSDWSPSSTWEGGPVTSAPPDDSGIQLSGATGATDTVSFSSPVTDPVFAIVSLGQNGITASFNFNDPFVLLGGGPSSEWGGQALTSGGDVVYGMEGNGLVMFEGTYSSITWTNPSYEYYYAVTVGSVPEVSTWAMMLLGFAGLGFAGYRRTKNAGARFLAA